MVSRPRVFFWPNHYKKCLYVHEKIQRNPSVRSGLKIIMFQPYGFDYFRFLTNARRGAMRLKTQWVIYRDLDWWPGPQKVQFGEITGYPEVVGLFLALLNVKNWSNISRKPRCYIVIYELFFGKDLLPIEYIFWDFEPIWDWWFSEVMTNLRSYLVLTKVAPFKSPFAPDDLWDLPTMVTHL